MRWRNLLSRSGDEQRDPGVEQGEQLRRALWLDQFSLYYQPVLDLTRGTLVGVEALLRWEHPDRGVVPAGEFIEAAEREALIVPIGNDAIRAAATFRKQLLLPDGADVRITVNLSESQLFGADLVATVARILTETELPAELVIVEVSEAILVAGNEAATRVLGDLHELGVSISVDDFGSHEDKSSLLHELPVDLVKIDVRLAEEPGGRDKLARLVTQAAAWGLPVTAKYVETSEQLRLLRELGISHAQGFVLGRPLPPGEFEMMASGGPEAIDESGEASGAEAELQTDDTAAEQLAGTTAEQPGDTSTDRSDGELADASIEEANNAA